MIELLADVWRRNNAANLALLNEVRTEQLHWQLPKSKSVRGQFAHIVNVRRMKLKMHARDLLDTDRKSDRHKAGIEELRADLLSTGAAFEGMILQAGSPGAKLKGAGLPVIVSLATLIAHEGNHRGQIEAALRAGGFDIPIEVQVQLWDWTKL